MRKIFKSFIKEIKYNYKSYIIFILLASLLFIKFDYYVYSPGGLIDLTDRIDVDNSYSSSGSFNLTYVKARNGTLPVILLSKIIPSWDLVSISSSQIEDESSKEIFKRNQIYLKETSYDAVIASFNAAGKEINITNIDVTVTYVYDIAKTDIEVGDIIKKINNNSISSYDELKTIIGSYNEGDNINVLVSRDNKDVLCNATLIKENDRNIIGINLSEIKTIQTNPNVEFVFKSSESGSSRGLMCALEIYNRITEYDLTKGLTIAGTGSIDADGVVGEIAGVKYKLKGAVKNNADVFIVPTNNYKEAEEIVKENDYSIKLIEAKTLSQVIEELKNM